MAYGRRIVAPAGLRGGRDDIPGGIFELFRWTRSLARAGEADDLVAVVKSILLHAPETFAGRTLAEDEVSALFDAVLSRRDAPLGFAPAEEDHLLARMLAGNVATLRGKGCGSISERDVFGRIPAFSESADLEQAVGVSAGLFLELPDPDEARGPTPGPR